MVTTVKMSRSYPYLWISREHGLPYGTVLCWADGYEKNYRAWNAHEHRAEDEVSALPPARRDAFEVDMEHARQLWIVARSRGMQAALAEDPS